MLVRQFSLKHGVKARAANITVDDEILSALTELGIPYPKPVIVLVGGAGGVGWWDKSPMSKALRIVAQLAEDTGAVVVDGGTRAGIMQEVGKQRKRYHFSFPLIGVVVERLLAQRDPQSMLDAHHTKFILVPGQNWGDESAWISKIATAIAGTQRSITILVNGGTISRKDVDHSLLENRPVFVMRGTGRMADEISLVENIIALDITEKAAGILAFLKNRLTEVRQ